MPGIGQTVDRESSELKKANVLGKKADIKESVSQMAHVSNRLVKDNEDARQGEASVPAGVNRTSMPKKFDQVLPLSIGVTTEPLYESQSQTMQVNDSTDRTRDEIVLQHKTA